MTRGALPEASEIVEMPVHFKGKQKLRRAPGAPALPFCVEQLQI